MKRIKNMIEEQVPTLFYKEKSRFISRLRWIE